MTSLSPVFKVCSGFTYWFGFLGRCRANGLELEGQGLA